MSRYLNKKFRKLRKKNLALLLSVVLILGAVIGGSLAFLQTNSGSVQNSFVKGHVGCVVNITDDGYVVKPDEKTNTPVKLRAAVVVNWVDNDGNVYWEHPGFTVKLGDGWELNTSDGFYYYGPDVLVGGSATPLKIICDQTKEGYSVQIQVLGEAIQAKPDEAPAVWTNGGAQ